MRSECDWKKCDDDIFKFSLQPPETMFPTTSGGRGGGMMMKKSGTSGQAASANNSTLPLNEALNVLIQGYIKGN